MRKVAEAKVREEAKKQRIEKKKKKKMLEYLQWLQDEVLIENATLLESIEGSQVTGTKYKEITSRDEEGQLSFKKAKEK